MRHNEELALYLFVVVAMSALLTGDDSTAWIGFLVFIIGPILGFGLELAVWWTERAETRQDERKKKSKQ